MEVFSTFSPQGGFPKPAYAQLITPPPSTPTPIAPIPALSSLGACFRDPKCAAVLLLGGGANSAATWHHFDQAHKQLLQEKARQKYCSVYPTDLVCTGQIPGILYAITGDISYEYPSCVVVGDSWKTVFKPWVYHFDINTYGSYQLYGPVQDVNLKLTPHPEYENIAGCTYDPKPAQYYTWQIIISNGNPPNAQSWGSGGAWSPLGQPPKLINLKVFPLNAQPDQGKPWESWPQEKQEQALELLNQPDFQDVTKSMPPGVGLNPGDKINDDQIIIPGQPKDDPNTPEDESQTRVVPGPLTIPGTPPSPPPPPLVLPTPQPLPTSPPSSSPPPSPDFSPQPNPSPSPSTQPPTASGEPPSPVPDPVPSPSEGNSSSSSPDQEAANSGTDTQAGGVIISERDVDQIFRNAIGHLPEDTPENRELLINTASNPNNYLGPDQYGNEWYAEVRPDRTQVWARVRNNRITNGGVNQEPRSYNPQTGLNDPPQQ